MAKVIYKGRTLQCPECGSQRLHKVGTVPTRSGPQQRVICLDCARRTSADIALAATRKATRGKKPVSLKPADAENSAEL